MHVLLVHFSSHVIIPLTQTGATPLYIASQERQSDVVNILIRNGAIVNMAMKVRNYYINQDCIFTNYKWIEPPLL